MTSGLALLTRAQNSRNVLGAIFMLPAAALLVVFLTYPLGLGAWLGFTDATIGRVGRFVGLDNFRSLLHDSVFWLSVLNTFIYTAAGNRKIPPSTFRLFWSRDRRARPEVIDQSL